MKKYLQHTLHHNRYNLIGAVLLFPFALLLGSDFLGRLIQGIFSHPNTAFYNYVSQTVLYSEFRGQAPLLWILVVYFPLAAILLNIIPFFSQIGKKNKSLTLTNTLFSNPLTMVIIGLGFLFIILTFGHDAIPCFVKHLFSDGLGSIGHTITVCQNA